MTGSNILIVEDEAVVSMHIASWLEAMGYGVAGRAATAEKALLLAEEKRPDLVLMDIRIKGAIDGIETARQMRERFRVPVVFLTAFADDAMLERAKLVQPFGYLLKPFEDRELKTVIEMALYKHQSEEEISGLYRLYAVLSQVNKMIVRTGSREELFEAVCRTAVEYGKLKIAWIGWLDSATRAVQPVAHWGDDHGWLSRMRVSAGDGPEGQGPSGMAIRGGKTSVCNDLVNDSRMLPWREAAADLGIRGVAAVPIRFRGEVCGALAVYVAEPHFFREKEIDLLEEVGMDLSYALDNLEREEQRKRAEEALHENEERLRSITSAVVDAIVMLDDQGRITFWNEAAETMFGLAREEALGKDLHETLTPACYREAQRSGFDKLRQTGQGCVLGKMLELTALHRDGHEFPVELSVASVRLQARLQLVGIIRDISARKEAEKALRDSEERCSTLVNGMKDILYGVSADGRVDFISPQVHTYGYSEAEVLGKHFTDFALPEDLPRITRDFQHTIATGEETMCSFRFRTKEGTIRWFEEVGRALRDTAGNIIGLTGMLRDITERRQTEDHIREQAALLQATRDAIIVWELERGVQFMNSAAEELTGQKLAEVRGAGLPQVLRPRSELALRAALQAVTEQGAWTGALTLRTAEGKEKDLDSRWSVLLDANGKPRSVLITCNDITEKKRLEAQYLRAQRLESVGTLASGVAHDLNNILSPIFMGANLLKENLEEAEIREIIGMILDSAHRGSETVKQLLTFARGTGSQQGPVQPRHLVKEIVRLLQQTFPKNIQIYTDYAQDPATVLADPSQIHQVMMNLCVNARDAMPEGEVLFITIENKTLDPSSVNIHPKARPIAYVVFKVSDSGTGIAPEILDRIFDPFFTTKLMGQGTGLGLATVLGIVDNHGGFVLVESQPGAGTTFQVYIPACAPAESAGGTREPSNVPPGHGELVLIVDDEPAILRLAENVLRRGGFLALTSSNASEAMQLYERNHDRIRAVLTDVMMPFADGRQLITLLFKEDPQLPIIAMSGLGTEEFQRETALLGARAFLCKPFSAEQLLSVLSKAIESGHRQ
jgi:PAS domain S-box-containing protein